MNASHITFIVVLTHLGRVLPALLFVVPRELILQKI